MAVKVAVRFWWLLVASVKLIVSIFDNELGQLSGAYNVSAKQANHRKRTLLVVRTKSYRI